MTELVTAGRRSPASTADDQRRRRLSVLEWPASVMAVFLVLHAGLGAAVHLELGTVLTAHAALVLGGAFIVVATRRDLATAAAVIGYVSVCDVLWRMGGAQAPWEAAKWGVAALSVVAGVRLLAPPLRLAPPAIVVLSLSPAILLVVWQSGLDASEAISFGVMGLLAMAAAAVFFGHVAMSRVEIRGLLWIMLGPIVAVAMPAAINTVGAQVSFDPTVSSVAASGGFGPNQVSSLIGLGVVLSAGLMAFERRARWRLVAGAMLIWLVIQSALTFSRGGLFNVAVAAVAAVAFGARGVGASARLIVAGVVFAGLGLFVVAPVVDDLSGGLAAERFSSGDTTSRGELMGAELRMFAENPVTGVGLGQAPSAREGRNIANHTEPTRLLAEHGVLGLVTIGAVLALAAAGIGRQPTTKGRAWSAALAAWSIAGMLHAATRICAIPFAMAMAQTMLTEHPERDNEPLDLTDESRPIGASP